VHFGLEVSRPFCHAHFEVAIERIHFSLLALQDTPVLAAMLDRVKER
jgi:hypothetical protein